MHDNSAKLLVGRSILILSNGVYSPWTVDCCRTLVATLPRDYAATADPYLGHTIGPITGYGVSRIRKYV